MGEAHGSGSKLFRCYVVEITTLLNGGIEEVSLFFICQALFVENYGNFCGKVGGKPCGKPTF